MNDDLDEAVNSLCNAVDQLSGRAPQISDDALVRLHDYAKRLELLTESVRKELVSRCQSRLETPDEQGQRTVCGMTLKMTQGARYIDDLRAAYIALRDEMPKELFLKACTVSPTKLEKFYAEARMAAGRFTGIDSVLSDFNEKMSSVIKRRDARKTLVRERAGYPHLSATSPEPPPEVPLDYDDIF